MTRRPSSGLRSVGDRLARAGIASRPGSVVDPLERFVTAWPTVVLPGAARRSWPHRLTRAGVLTVACSDAGWAQELGANAERLTERLASAVPDIPLTRLRFSVADRERTSNVVTPPPRRPPKPARAHLAIAESAVQGVADDELRSALKRTIAAALALREGGNRVGDAGPR